MSRCEGWREEETALLHVTSVLECTREIDIG